MASCVRHLEHLPHQVHQEICKHTVNFPPCWEYPYFITSCDHRLGSRVGRSLKELAIYLNRLLTAVQLSMQNVSHIPIHLSNMHSPHPLQLYPPLLPALYLLYAKLEEEHGLARHAMTIYDRATKAVTPEEQFEVSLERRV